jgi:Asp-tRNA(Asn)/Glu-tRNA(Gln) amidotransferase A subunit family amidase
MRSLVLRMKQIMLLVRTFTLVMMMSRLLIVIADTPEAYMNAPVAIQVVGRTLEEEAVIGMSEIVDSALKSSMKARL